MRRVFITLLCLSGSAAAAETQMTATDFEAWSTGKTLVYSRDGNLWGSETHLAGRGTVDDDEGGICRSGQWYPRGDDICFTYENSPGPFCWRFLRDGDQVFAQYSDDAFAPRFAVTLGDAPVACTPGVGV